MKIIIVGAGRIGVNLAKSLSAENNEVYLIERSEDIARKNIEKLDVQVVVGSGADPEILQKAHVAEAELVLAVTTSDETNLVVCSLAGLFGAKRRIARVRNTSLSTLLLESGYDQFNVNEIINPELVAAKAIVKIVETPGASEVADFAQGRLLLRAFDLVEASPLCGLKIQDLKDEDFPWPFLIIAFIRNDSVIIPSGETALHAGGRIYVLLPANSLGEFLTFVNPQVNLPKKVVIYGATITGRHVAMALSGKGRDIIIIEEDAARAEDVAAQLTAVRVINGSPSETEILAECGIEAADAFIATSDNDYANLISSVLAKKRGAKTTVITTQQQDYMSIVNALDIDAVINPYHLAVEQILRLARGKGISSVSKLLEGNAEALELVAEEGAPITQDALRNIRLPKNSIVGAVYGDKEVNLAKGDTHIKAGERVIVFCQEPAIKKLQTLFTHR